MGSKTSYSHWGVVDTDINKPVRELYPDFEDWQYPPPNQIPPLYPKYNGFKTKQKQVGGNHYNKMKIQPIDYITQNNLGWHEGHIVKYVSRWKDKGGVEDLKKAAHYLEMLIESQENVKG